MFWRKHLPVFASLLLLATAAAAERGKLVTPASTAGYHARVRAAGAALPTLAGDWDVTDFPISEEAAWMLGPNLMVQRRYANRETGEWVQVLLVQSPDAGALIGHYPPNCYPGSGWTLIHSEPATVGSGDDRLNGVQYTFANGGLGQSVTEVVFNCFMMPDGRVLPDMDAYVAQATNARLRFYGAAEIQIVTAENLPAEERAKLSRLVLEAYRPVISLVRSGAVR